MLDASVRLRHLIPGTSGRASPPNILANALQPIGVLRHLFLLGWFVGP